MLLEQLFETGSTYVITTPIILLQDTIIFKENTFDLDSEIKFPSHYTVMYLECTIPAENPNSSFSRHVPPNHKDVKRTLILVCINWRNFNIK